MPSAPVLSVSSSVGPGPGVYRRQVQLAPAIPVGSFRSLPAPNPILLACADTAGLDARPRQGAPYKVSRSSMESLSPRLTQRWQRGADSIGSAVASAAGKLQRRPHPPATGIRLFSKRSSLRVSGAHHLVMHRTVVGRWPV